MRSITTFLIAAIMVVLIFELFILYGSMHSANMGTGFVNYDKTAEGNFNLVVVSQEDMSSYNMSEVCLLDHAAEDTNKSSCEFIDEFIQRNCDGAQGQVCRVQDGYCCCPGHLFVSNTNETIMFFCESPLHIIDSQNINT